MSETTRVILIFIAFCGVAWLFNSALPVWIKVLVPVVAIGSALAFSYFIHQDIRRKIEAGAPVVTGSITDKKDVYNPYSRIRNHYYQITVSVQGKGSYETSNFIKKSEWDAMQIGQVIELYDLGEGYELIPKNCYHNVPDNSSWIPFIIAFAILEILLIGILMYKFGFKKSF